MTTMGQRPPGSLELAYLGDTIYDLYVRLRLVSQGGKMKDIHMRAVKLVCASAQSAALRRIEPMLTGPEADVVRRARNAKQSPPKNADPAEYHRATSLEALIGHLFLSGQNVRMEEIITAALDAPEPGKTETAE